MTFRPKRSWIGPLLLIAVAAVLVAACLPGSGGVDASGNRSTGSAALTLGGTKRRLQQTD